MRSEPCSRAVDGCTTSSRCSQREKYTDARQGIACSYAANHRRSLIQGRGAMRQISSIPIALSWHCHQAAPGRDNGQSLHLDGIHSPALKMNMRSRDCSSSRDISKVFSACSLSQSKAIGMDSLSCCAECLVGSQSVFPKA